MSAGGMPGGSIGFAVRDIYLSLSNHLNLDLMLGLTPDVYIYT